MDDDILDGLSLLLAKEPVDEPDDDGQHDCPLAPLDGRLPQDEHNLACIRPATLANRYPI